MVLHRVTLPSGLQLHVVSIIDAQLEAKANQDNQVYYDNDGLIVIDEGDVVLDVGANIGSFARTAAEAAGADGRVVCVEPLPDVAAALRLNIESHASWAAAQQLATAPVEVVEAGLGDGSQPAATFTYYPCCTALSTMYENVPDVLAATGSIVRNSGSPTSWLQWVANLAARAAPGWYSYVHGAVFSWFFLGGSQVVVCPMKTVSELIEELGLREVSLLKINVERAEMDVLAGIKPAHWPHIKQVSMQVHDLQGRLQAALDLLRGPAAYPSVMVYKEPRFADCCLYMVYAKR